MKKTTLFLLICSSILIAVDKDARPIYIKIPSKLAADSAEGFAKAIGAEIGKKVVQNVCNFLTNDDALQEAVSNIEKQQAELNAKIQKECLQLIAALRELDTKNKTFGLTQKEVEERENIKLSLAALQQYAVQPTQKEIS